MGGKKLFLPGCNEFWTNRGSDKQRIGKTEVPTNISLNKQRFGQTEVRRPFAQPLGSRKYIFFVPLIALKAIFSLLECIKVQTTKSISLDASKFGQTEVRTNRGSHKQSFFTLDFFSQKKFFLENKQAYIFLTLPRS